jgi:GNAT superfamily N-acetyltransferase
MSTQSAQGAEFGILPATPERWADLEALFGPHGAFGGCWCTWWRYSSAEWNARSGGERREKLKSIVDMGEVPGLLAYAGEKPVGWISLGPRMVFPRLERSRTARPVDDRPVWSIVCFFVERHSRRQGVTVALLKGAIDYARQQGAQILEGYPVDKPGVQPDPWVFTGLAEAFRKVGFEEVARRSETRPIMRFYLE